MFGRVVAVKPASRDTRTGYMLRTAQFFHGMESFRRNMSGRMIEPRG